MKIFLLKNGWLEWYMCFLFIQDTAQNDLVQVQIASQANQDQDQA